MSLRIHHLNCGTMCPSSARFVTGEGGWFERARMVCHCLLIESPDGLVLVDTGLGTRDVAEPERLGRRFIRRSAPRLDQNETALAQVQRLGFRPSDVRHIVPTHLDLDHAGGLADFPQAEVHLFGDEYRAALSPRGASAKLGYRRTQWAHGPLWRPLELSGEHWFGFDSVRAIPALEDEVLLVPLQGHSEGHCGVAVRTAQGWLLHAGDAYFHHREVDPQRPRTPPGLELFQRLRSVDNRARLDNLVRLRALVREHPADVSVFSAHCATEFERLSAQRSVQAAAE
jgi:glyoxylase-like metal-dependent hydrolase (beta-lactamase superfamily II)